MQEANMILAFILVFSSIALGGDDGEKKVIYKSTTEIDFEDLEIEGTLQKPQSALVLERKKAAFNPLVKLRTDWNAEIDESVDSVK
jgi:hypothetical protein